MKTLTVAIQLVTVGLLSIQAGALSADHRPGHSSGGGKGITLNDLSCASGDIPKFNGTTWECGEDHVGGGNAWVLMDSDSPPKPVGEILSVGNRVVEVALPIGNTVVAISVSVSGAGTRIDGNVDIFFEDEFCTGTPYVRPSEIDVPGFFGFVPVSRSMPAEPEARVPLEVIGGERDIQSQRKLLGGICFPATGQFPAVPVAPSGEQDLTISYPPPYTLELQ